MHALSWKFDRKDAARLNNWKVRIDHLLFYLFIFKLNCKPNTEINTFMLNTTSFSLKQAPCTVAKFIHKAFKISR